MKILETWWAPSLGLLLLAGMCAMLGGVDLPVFATMLVVPAVFLGLHFQEQWPRPARGGFLAFLVAAGAGYSVPLAMMVRRRLQGIPEWDFLGFWLHARTAVLRLNFYDPRNAQELAASFGVSESFRKEIVDVGFWYPPPSMFVFWPLGWFDRPTALALWYAAQIAIAIVCVVLLWKVFFPGKGVVELTACATLVLAARGTWSTFYFSQTTFVALLTLLLFWRRRDSAAGGWWAAVAFFAKPFLGVLALYQAVGRRGRAIVGLLVSMGALTLASAVVFGPGTFAAYFIGGPVGEKPSWIYSEPTNQSLLGWILRTTDAECSGMGCIMNPYFLCSALVLGVITLVLGFRLARAHGEWAAALFLLFALLVYPVSQVFYSVLLIPVLLLLWRERARFAAGPWPVAMMSGAIYGLSAVNNGRVTVAAFAALWAVVAVVGTMLVRRQGGSGKRSGAGKKRTPQARAR